MESAGGSNKLTGEASEMYLPPGPPLSHKEFLLSMGTESFGEALCCHSGWPYFLEDFK